MKLRVVLLPIVILGLVACGGNDSSSLVNQPAVADPDIVMMNRIDNQTGFMVALKGDRSTDVYNTNGVELNPATGITTYKGNIYTVGSLYKDTVTKWRYNGVTFVKDGEFITGEGARAGSIIFVNDTKAYVVTYGLPILQIFNPTTMEKTGTIDLSPYALGKATDNNPNATEGVIRDGKLFLGLAQIDTLQTFFCQAGASMLIIDVATDSVEKHIQDSRACMSGALDQGSNAIFMDELGDIYVNNLGAYGYYPQLKSGYLRIKSGAEEFDPDYFFSITDLDLSGQVKGGRVSYIYRQVHVGNGVVYGNAWVPALSSNPPDFVNDKNYVAYKLDLRNQTATLIDMPATTGWSAGVLAYQGKILFARTTDVGTGLFSYDPGSGTTVGSQEPIIFTSGSPVFIQALE